MIARIQNICWLIRSLILLPIIFSAQAAFAGEFAVSPMLIEMSAQSREEQQFEFSLFGKSDTNIKLTLFDMNQLETGYMGFTEIAEDDLESMASWIDLERDRFRIRDGETTTVRGTVKVPARAAGTHLVGVMVEEDVPEDEQGGISVKIRYAVVLNLRVEGRYARIKTEFGELVAVTQEDGTYLEGYFKNDSAVDNWLFTEVQLRGEDNRLIDRIPLKTESAWQRADIGSRVFPGARVRMYGKISKAFDTGNYNILVRNKFADKTQPVFRETVYLEAPSAKATVLASTDTTEASETDTGTISVNPGAVEVSIRSNGTSFATFSIQNTKSEPVTITLPSVLDNLEAQGVSSFQFYPETVSIKPNQKSRVVLRQTHVEGADYGNITFPARVASAASDEGELLSIATVRGS